MSQRVSCPSKPPPQHSKLWLNPAAAGAQRETAAPGCESTTSTIRKLSSRCARGFLQLFRCYRVSVFKFNKRSPLMSCFVVYLFPCLRLPIKGRFVTYITSLIVMISQMSRGQKTFQLNKREATKNRALNNNELRLIDFLLRRRKTDLQSPGPATAVDAQWPDVEWKSLLHS